MLLVNDRALLDRFRRGEKEALAEVYRTYAPTIAGLLKSGFSFESQDRRCRFQGTRSTFDLEDRLQEVFARAFRERARLAYDGLSPYRAYILKIARNLVIDDFRRKEHALVEYAYEPPEPALTDAVRAPSEPFEGMTASTGQPDVDLTERETVDLFFEFCATLSAREQLVVQLRFREELEHRDIAKRTGLSVSQVKTSELRIRRTFFRFMKKRGYFDGYHQDRKGWLSSLRRAWESPR